jgi:1,4-dihydroxy-2-naphthoate octaprenyltransferase
VSRLITLQQTDPQFKNYLLGTFSKTERAIPINSLNVNSSNEVVTFRIENISEIKKPSLFVLLAQIFKLKTFVLVALPLFLILAKNYVDGVSFDPTLAVLSAMAALSLHAAVNLRNDFRDHMRGLDRVHPTSGSRAIQMGWVTAHTALVLSRVYFFLGILLGLPAVFVFPELLGFIGILAILAIVTMSSFKIGLKYRRWTELIAFFLLGPLLTIGYQIAIGGGFDLESLIIGIATGWLAVFVLHLKNFENIMVNSQAGFMNTMAWLGFEKSKKVLLGWWLLLGFFILGYHIIFSSQTWFVVFLLTFAVFTFLIGNYLRKLKSPVGSEFIRVCEKCYRIVLFVMAMWALESLSYIGVLEIATQTR